MIWASKINTEEEIDKLNGIFGTDFTRADTVFSLNGNSILGAGGLKAGEDGVFELITAYAANTDERFKEMLIRSVLAFVRDYDFVIKTSDTHECFFALGFKDIGNGILQAVAKDLIFDCGK